MRGGKEMEDLKHFSHVHPLECIESGNGSITCSGCMLPITNKIFYHCKVCSFSVHKVCFTMPEKVMHPADVTHRLTLVASLSANQSTSCDACGSHIAGFYYSCIECSLYYHMLCVAMPLSVKIASSHPHALKLEFKPPYDFRCDLCDKPSYSGWLYRCRICEFDAHMSCAVTFREDQSSVPNCAMRGFTSHQHELMELLTERMKEKNEKNVHQDDLQTVNESIIISESFTLPSCQFSDACFSIDIAKSICIEENSSKETEKNMTLADSAEKLEAAKRESSSYGKRDLKQELSRTCSSGIESHVWSDLGCASKNRSLSVSNEKMQSEDHTITVKSKCPFWSKIMSCF